MWNWLTEITAPKPAKQEIPVTVVPVGAPTELAVLEPEQRRDPAALVNLALGLSSNRERPARYADFELMDVGDIAAMIDSVVAAALTFEDARAQQGFKVETFSPRAQEVVDLCLERTGLQDLIFLIARDLVKYGDAFAEPVYHQRELVETALYPVAEITRTHDDKGKLPAAKDDNGFPIAFQQRKQGNVIAGWQPWELVHFRLWEDPRLAYSSKGLLDDLRANWRKLEIVEQSLVVARSTRAYPRRVHYIDLTNKTPADQKKALTSYMAAVTRSTFGTKALSPDNVPLIDVGEDLYIGTGFHKQQDGKLVERRTRVETEDPAIAGLSELADVEYLRQKNWSSVPGDVVGIKRNTTGDLDSQDLAYARLLRRIQRRLEVGIRALIKQALIAAGMPDEEFTVVFPPVIVGAAWKHADARFKDSLTLRNFVEMGALSRRTIVKRALGWSDQEYDLEIERIVEEINSPVFAPVLPFRNGLPSATDLNTPDTVANKTDIGPDNNSLDTAPTGAAALADLDPEKAKSITSSGVYRGTDLSKRLRGNNSA